MTRPAQYRVTTAERHRYKARIYALGYTQEQAAIAIGLSSPELSRWLRGHIASDMIRQRFVTWLERREAAQRRRMAQGEKSA